MDDHNHTHPDQSGISPPEDVLEAALLYCEKGFRSFPCLPGRKEPAIKAWQNHATTEPKIARGWFAEFPDRNIAIACGPQPNGMNLLVVDIDPLHGGLDSWRRLVAHYGRGFMTETAVHRTPHGGWHLFFNAPSDFRNSRNKLGEGIDTRGAGGYVLVPPSKLFVATGELVYRSDGADLWSV